MLPPAVAADTAVTHKGLIPNVPSAPQGPATLSQDPGSQHNPSYLLEKHHGFR